LTANLLAPVGAGVLAPSISQQEYSKLFERDRLGVASITEFLSRGAVMQQGAQYGAFGNTAYALEASYSTDPGQRANNDFEQRILTLKLKQQITPQDTIYAEAVYAESSGGDLIQRYNQGPSLGVQPIEDPTLPLPGLRFKQNHDPDVYLGYHREWGPGTHTLLLGTRLNARLSVKDLFHSSFFINRENGRLVLIEPMFLNTHYRTSLEIYSGELQQIWQQPRHTTIIGSRYQTGNFRTTNSQTFPIVTEFSEFFDPDNPAAQQETKTDFERVSAYAYHSWQVFEPLILFGGLSYDWLRFPENLSAPPISSPQSERDQLSPKAGAIWRVTSNTTARAAYTRSLGGASIDQSARIEPTQVAGFNQAFRSIQPEALGGTLIGARFTTYDASLEHRFPTRTYVGLSAERLESKQSSPLGAFQANLLPPGFPPFLSSITQKLDYREESLLFTINQLLSGEWALGARYRLTDAQLKILVPDVAPGAPQAGFRPEQTLESTLHQLTLHAIYNHPSGFFAQGEAAWYAQSNRGFAIDHPGDDFWQFNLLMGIRLPGRNVELAVGVLNLQGQDYRLEPLTLYNDLPRDRTFVMRVHLNF